jgi:hypothetical protein
MAATAIAAATTKKNENPRSPVGLRLTLDAESLTLTTECLPEIAQLVFDHIGNCLTRRIQRVSDLAAHRVDRHAIPKLATTLRCPACAATSALAGPTRGITGHPGDWRNWTSPARTASQ